jgi:hypothetical protein
VITYDRHEVVWRLPHTEAHELGEYLFDIGERTDDLIWKDGERLIVMAHRAMDSYEWERHVQQGCAWKDKRW